MSDRGDVVPLITTIIPTFRRPHMLRRAVSSVLDQRNVPLQVSVFDNASDDDTSDVVAAMAAVDHRVRYHCHPRNIGGMANFEFGLRSVDTPFFSVLSDDDYLIPGFYRRALDDLASHPEAMFWAGMTLNADEDGKIWDARVAAWPREGLFTPPEGLLRVMHGMHPVWTGILFRREVLDRVGYPDTQVLGPFDLDFILRVAARFPYLLYKVPVAVYTLNATSFSATEPLSSFWPGWQKMFRNLESDDGIGAPHRKEALSALRADGRRMLFRRGVNAIVQGRYDFAEDAATALSESYRELLRPGMIRCIAWACRRSRILNWICVTTYRFVERQMVRSRSGLLRQYERFIRSV